MKLVIVSGYSGSGRTIALHMLEDLGYYSIDNLPPNLLPTLVDDALTGEGPGYEKLAIGIDARASQQELDRFAAWLPELRAKLPETRLLFLRCDEQILLARYSETRRSHPLGNQDYSLEEAIKLEQVRLDPIAEHADLIIETSHTTVHQLRELVREQIDGEHAEAITLLVNSFAFKRGTPPSADFVFDVRCLPNPYWEPPLRELTGQDEPVAEWLGKQPLVTEQLADIRNYLDRWLPKFAAVDRSYVTIAIGCTGGRHRSVYIAEQLVAGFRQTWPQVLLRHRGLEALAATKSEH